MKKRLNKLSSTPATGLLVGGLRDESDLAHEAGILAPIDRQRRRLLDRYRAATPKLELAVRNVRVLARAGVRAIELDPSTGSSCRMRFLRSHPRDRP